MLEKISENVEIHQTLPDVPNLTTEELKKEWDKGCKILKEAFNKLVGELNENMFPIGFRMFINNDKDYSKHLGFTWQKVAKGRVLVGLDENDTDFNEIGKKGGEKTHTITINEMPSHKHGALGITTTGDRVNYFSIGGANGGTGDITAIQNSGNDEAHNNLQPYEIVNIWERVL